MTSLPRVLLVEDDASIRRFVAMALEDLPVALVQTPTLAAARQALAEGPFALLLTDLMLPDGSGAALLRELQSLDPGRARPRAVAFSAGLTPARLEELAGLGVVTVLAKPVSLRDLERCVREAIGAAGDGEEPNSPGQAKAEAEPEPRTASGRTHAIRAFFDGDEDLFEHYRRGCLRRFGDDAAQGDAACAARDLAGLRRLAHSLKSVLEMTGQTALAQSAADIEHAAERGDAAALVRWAPLGRALRALAGAAGA